MKNIITVFVSMFLIVGASFSQEAKDLSATLRRVTSKGDYAVLEVRLNNEDEFRTIEGSSSSLARVSVFTGKNMGQEVVSKGFDGMNEIVGLLNNLKSNGWRLVEVYDMSGNSLLITHYLLERRK